MKSSTAKSKIVKASFSKARIGKEITKKASNAKVQEKLSHNVYVIELNKKIWSESKKFRDANPHYNGLMTCLYVGMTSHDPKERFQKHVTGYRTKKGIKISSSVVENYGMYLRPSLYSRFNPLTKVRATQLEKDLANSLKKRGYAVWWN